MQQFVLQLQYLTFSSSAVHSYLHGACFRWENDILVSNIDYYGILIITVMSCFDM